MTRMSLTGLCLLAACAPRGVSISVSGQGAVFDGSNSCRDQCEFSHVEHSVLDAKPDEGWFFAGWSGEGVDLILRMT